jgi:hypothetical protein
VTRLGLTQIATRAPLQGKTTMISLVFSTPILAHDERNTQLATVNDALAVLRSERFDAYRYTKAGNERPAWTDAVEALTTAQTTMTLEATALARSATVRLLAFAARFLDRPAEQPSGDWRLAHLR